MNDTTNAFSLKTLNTAKNEIIRISLPIEYNPGSTNSYLLLGKEPALIDTGLGYPGSVKFLLLALEALNFSPTRLKHIFLTHAHPDHAGAVAYLHHVSKAKVWAHPMEDSRLNGKQAEFLGKKAHLLFKSFGAPLETIQKIQASFNSAAGSYHWQNMESYETFPKSGVLPLDDYDLIVLSTPGHSPGSVCFFEKNEKLIFTGDTLLPGNFPRPILCLSNDGSPNLNGLLELRNSLHNLLSIRADTFLSGHGPETNFKKAVTIALKKTERTREMVKKKLESGNTAYDIIKKRVLRTKGKYLTIDLFNTRNALESLIIEGLVRKNEKSGIEYFFHTK